MPSSKTKFSVGLFVIVGIALGLGAVIWLGVTRFFESGSLYVTYFNESVQGLNKDSQVKFRGVPVGRVRNIAVAPDSQHIEVIIWIESGWKPDDSVVAQLKPVGITGSVFIELDQRKKQLGMLTPKIDFTPKHPVIPSKSSSTKALFEGVDEVVARINQTLDEADVQGLSNALKNTLAGIDNLTNNPGIPRLIASLEASSKQLNKLMQGAETDLETVEATLVQVQGVIEKNESLLHETLININESATAAQSLMDTGSENLAGMNKRVETLLENINETGNELNQLLQDIRRNPSQLLRGEPPAPRSVEPDA